MMLFVRFVFRENRSVEDNTFLMGINEMPSRTYHETIWHHHIK